MEIAVWTTSDIVLPFHPLHKHPHTPFHPLHKHPHTPFGFSSCRVLMGTTRQDHHSFLSALRAARAARSPLSKVLDAHKQTEEYR